MKNNLYVKYAGKLFLHGERRYSMISYQIVIDKKRYRHILYYRLIWGGNVKMYLRFLIVITISLYTAHGERSSSVTGVSDCSDFDFFNTRTDFLLDTSRIYCRAPQHQIESAIASDGSTCFVVWSDYRSSFCGQRDIYGARIGPTGILLDSAGIPIARTVKRETSPAIVFGASLYLVTWTAFTDYGQCDVFAARVTVNGVLVDTTAIPIATGPEEQCASSVAFDGENFLVVWQEGLSFSNIYGVRVSQMGIILDTIPIIIAQAANDQQKPSLTFDGENYIVVWQDNRSSYVWDIYGARVTPEGELLDSTGFIISAAFNPQSNPYTCTGNTGCFVVWQDMRDSDWKIYGTRITTDGVVLDTAGIVITNSWDALDPTVTFDGNNYLAVWLVNNIVHGARVSQDGILLDTQSIIISDTIGQNSAPAVIYDGNNFSTTWSFQLGERDCDILNTRVTSQGVVLDSVCTCISTTPHFQYNPAVSSDGINHFVVWEDNRSDTHSDIFGARIDDQGTLLDVSMIPISTAEDAQRSPAIDFDGTNYLVTWTDRRNAYDQVYGTRVTTSGTVLDSTGFMISPPAPSSSHPALLYGDTSYLAVWNSLGCIVGAFITPQGVVSDTFRIGIGYETAASIAFDGTYFLVVWNNWDEIYAARVTQDGFILDPTGIWIAGSTDSVPSVAFDGTNYMVVWHAIDSHSSYGVFGTRITTQGEVIDTTPIPIAETQYDEYRPSVTFCGTKYVVVWHTLTDFLDIMGARINTNGTVCDTFYISSDIGNQLPPVSMVAADNEMFITFAGWTETINNHPAHTIRIWGTFHSFTGTEEQQSIPSEVFPHFSVSPNPFQTQVKILLTSRGGDNNDTILQIFDAAGRVVKNFDEYAGQFHRTVEIVWSGTDDSGTMLPAGVYFCRLKTGGSILTRKIIKLK